MTHAYSRIKYLLETAR